MLATLSLRSQLVAVSVPEMLHAQLVSTAKGMNASHAHLIVLPVFPSPSARPVLKVSRLMRWSMIMSSIRTVLRSAVMGEDSSLTAMTVTRRMVTVAMITARLKPVSTAKVDQVSKLVLASTTSHQDLT